MLWDTDILKDELVADIDNVQERLADAGEDEMESALIAVERFVFWTAFVIRRMADSYKLSDEFESSEWEVESIPKKASVLPSTCTTCTG
jgi:hypothetical protein